MPTPFTEPDLSVRVFISYSHADQELRRKLDNHLSTLKRQGLITVWQDQEIPAGANWKEQINTRLSEADLILLLISVSFIASDYCWNKEVEIALERHKDGSAWVIPIILKPTDWQNTPLGQLQALPTRKSVTQWVDQEAAFIDVIQGIRRAIEELKRHRNRQCMKVADEHYQAGRYTEALAACEQAIHFDPNDPYAYNGKGNALRELERYEEAIATYEQATHLHPYYAIAYYNMGNVFQKLGRQKEAESAHKMAQRRLWLGRGG